MRRATTVWLSCGLALALAHATALAKNLPGEGYAGYQTMETPVGEGLPADLRARVATPRLSSAVTDTFHLAWFSFNTGGGANRQGWTSIDRQLFGSDNPNTTHFHVADASELDGGDLGRLLPLEGAQSMWCGIDANGGDPYCRWICLPGYGNFWDQMLQSKQLVCDSVRLYYKISWDSEPGYDRTVIQHFDEGSGDWVTWAGANGGAGHYDGFGLRDECWMFGVPSGQTQIRLRFTSDASWSDEDGYFCTDGAVTVDSITIECYTGGVATDTFYSDFEAALPGSNTDGCWTATVPPGFGDFAALYPSFGGPGDGAPAIGIINHYGLQEDPCTDVKSYVWGFFDDPVITPYDCHLPSPAPLQGTVRFGPDARGLYLNNEIWSPLIPVAGSAGNVWKLRFRVYRDLPFDNLVFYVWSVRSWPSLAGCPSEWRDENLTYFGGQKDWLWETYDVSAFIDPGVAYVQIRLGAIDMCPFRCSVFGTGTCHSHGPLFDDVQLIRIDASGPQFSVRHMDLFQDNFAEDGTTTGTARADQATDVLSEVRPEILPGDSIRVLAREPIVGMGTDPFTGAGPAIYAYVSVWPEGQPGKAGPALEATEMRNGKRYPLVDSLLHDGVWWYCFRFDTVFSVNGVVRPDEFCFDLNDEVFTPCDTVCYVLRGVDALGNSRYLSRRFDGQGANFTTADLWEALNSPMEFTILPAGGWKRGGDILYVDHSDDRGGPLQLYFDSSFDLLGILEQVDRFDVLAPSSDADNGLGSRVRNVDNQIVACYRKIIYSTGNLSTGLVGDGGPANGGMSTNKSNDWAVLNLLAKNGPNNPGFYLTGDDLAEDWNTLLNEAVSFRSDHMNFNLVTGDHATIGQPTSPCLAGVGDCFTVDGVPDTLIAYGGCELVNAFDVLGAPVGGARVALREATQPAGQGYALSEESYPSGTGSADTVRVILEGFSFHYIAAKEEGYPHPRVTHLEHVIRWLRNDVEVNPTGANSPAVAFLAANYPNPFNPVTTIRYGVKETGQVSLKVYNVAGQLVKTLVDEVRAPQAGGYVARWDGTSNAGDPVASGVYFYRLVTKELTQTRKMVLLK